MRDWYERIRRSALGVVFLTAAVVIALGCVYVACSNSLHRTCFVTGWVLFAALAAAFTRRFLRIRAGVDPQRWVGQQAVFAVAMVTLFLMHVEFTIPNGWLDSVLAALFLVVVGTGSAGVVLWLQLRSGTISATCQTPDSEHARAQARILAQAEDAVREADVDAGAILGSLGRKPRFWRRALWGNDLAKTLRLIEVLKASAPNAETRVFETLSTLAIEKDRLDAQRVGDRVVRRWLLVHMPCVACLLALGTMHGMIAHAHGLLAHVMLGK